ncbi:hypothetical protein AGLY_005961 [Aphis glycines]|uniref:Uncharacterized protein n=1 Tax=Aphis glycines TaxID=307491 RepID=A0A6G0TTN6_APHGL|nr:hypothetical protein AGLY_005961 [Aphis glycines]
MVFQKKKSKSIFTSCRYIGREFEKNKYRPIWLEELTRHESHHCQHYEVICQPNNTAGSPRSTVTLRLLQIQSKAKNQLETATAKNLLERIIFNPRNFPKCMKMIFPEQSLTALFINGIFRIDCANVGHWDVSRNVIKHICLSLFEQYLKLDIYIILDILIKAHPGYYYPRKIIPRSGYENLDINKFVAGLYDHGGFAMDIFNSCFIQLFD